MVGFIYKTTCLVNNKIYIGKHEGSENDIYIGSGELFQRAVRKYGKKNFKREILRRCETLHELRIWEYVYIKKYHSQDLKIGYNIVDGDVNTTEYNPAKRPEVKYKIKIASIGRKLSNETRKKISDGNKGKKRSLETRSKISKNSVGFRGKKHTDESRKKMSDALRGRVFSEEHRKKLSESLKGVNNWSRGKKRIEHSIKMSGMNNPMFGSRFMWITNGTENKRFKGEESEIPNGWRKGKIERK